GQLSGQANWAPAPVPDRNRDRRQAGSAASIAPSRTRTRSPHQWLCHPDEGQLTSLVMIQSAIRRSVMWLRNCWQVIAFANEIGETPLARTVCNEPIVLFRTRSGEAVALADRCPHRLAPLSLGRVVGEQIQCGYHGLCFDRDGQCVRVPGQDQVPSRARVRKYPLVERHTFAWIWMGDAALADPAVVPDFHWMDDPAWACVPGYHHF